MFFHVLELLGHMTAPIGGNGREVVAPGERDDLDGVVFGGVLLLVHVGNVWFRGRRYENSGYVAPFAATF